MEEEKLLFYVKIILLLAFIFKQSGVFAEEENIPLNLPPVTNEGVKWANGIADQFKQIARKETIDKFLLLKGMQGASEELELYTNKKNGLRIFVSGSMPVSMLKAYSLDAAKYGGSLVFKGLPSGNFRELAKLIMEISKEGVGGFGHIQIDDGAFDKFGINAVPAIVLSNNEWEGFLSLKSEKEEFDKVLGAIGVKLALEKFAGDGDLKDVAVRFLNQ